MSHKIAYVCVSHPGKVRRINQDNFICHGQYMSADKASLSQPLHGSCSSSHTPLFGVFDGMGGEECGEAASFIAAQCASMLKVSNNALDAFATFCQEANQAICDFANREHVHSTGTTAAMLLFQRKLYLCNIGDSKVFRFRRGKLTQLSEDHLSFAPFGVKRPLSQNLGIPADEFAIRPFLQKFPYAVNDTYLICSDGLTDMLPNEEISEILSKYPLCSAVDQLLNRALDSGGKDNISIILCKVEKEPWHLFQKNDTVEKRGKNHE